MAKAKEARSVAVDVTALEGLCKAVGKLQKRNEPAADVVRARIKAAFRAHAKGDMSELLSGVAHSARLAEISGDSVDPESAVWYLASCARRLGALVSELNRIEVRP